MSREKKILPHVERLLEDAAVLVQRCTQADAARKLGVPATQLYTAICRHPERWQKAVEQARAARLAAGKPVDVRDPSDATREKMRDAAALIAAGHTRIEAAEKLDFRPGTIDAFHQRHPDAWKRELDSAREAMLARVKAQGGTEDDLKAAPSPEVRDGIAEAARLLAAGYKRDEVAEQMAITEGKLDWWQQQHRAAWDRAVDEAMRVSREMIRRLAGTNRVFDDPGAYMRQVEACDRWSRGRGETVLDAKELTLGRFYREWFVPVRLGDVTDKHREGFARAILLWELATGDPALDKITPETMATFLDFLKQLPGQKAGSTMAPNTVRRYLQHVQWVLDRTGPPTRGCRDAAGILDSVPWVKPPRATIREPRIIDNAEIDAVYRAASQMDRPDVEGIRPADWWRGLLAVAFNTGLRAGSLFAMRWEHVDLVNRVIDLPADVMKARRHHRVFLNDAAAEHLERINGDRVFVFPWPRSNLQFYKAWSQLLRHAGIPDDRRFTLQNFRQTCATNLAEQAPELARLTLGHVSLGTTADHYIGRDRIARRAMERIEQPAAFRKGATG